MPDGKYTQNDYRTQDEHDVKLIDNEDGTHSISVGANRDNPLLVNQSDFSGRSPFVTVFGEQVVGQRQNNINIPFLRNNGNIGTEENLKSTRFISTGTATETNENQTAYIDVGTGVGFAELYSRNTNRYVTGHGNDDFETMVFDGLESGVDSGVGYGRISQNDFIGFGYQGTTFGIWQKLRGIETFIPQSSWNENTLLDGDFILDPQKENIGGKAFGWLGVADILYYINASENDWILVHRHKVANIDTKPHLSNPTQPISTWIRRESGSGANIRVGTSSWFAGTVGNRASGTGADKFPFIKRTVTGVSTEEVLLSIRNRQEFPSGSANTVRLRYGTLTLTSDGTKAVEFNVYLNGVDGNVGEWGYYDEDLSVSEINIDSPLALTNRTIVTGLDKANEQVGGTFLNKVDRDRINLFSTDVVIAANAGDIITITAKSQNSTDISFEMRWIEEF